MTKNLQTLLFILAFVGLNGQNLQKKSLEIPELSADNVSINGVLDETVWASSARIRELDKYFPEAVPTPEGIRSDVRIFYTQEGIYFAGTFEDDRAPILSQLTPRDRINANTDWIHIILNPFNDGANDFNFYLSAAGVQGDSRATGAGSEDGS